MQKALLLFLLIFQFAVAAFSQQLYIDSLQAIIALDKHDDNEMKAFVLLATNCHRVNPEKAKNYLANCLKLATPANNFDRQCAAYSLLLAVYQDEGKMDSAIYCVNSLKKIADKASGNNKVLGNYNQALGLYYKKTGDYNTALPYLLAAAKYAEINTTNKASIAGQWLNAGNLYQDLGDYNNAMICHLKALRLFEDAGNKLGESFCYNSICNNYSKLNQYPKALEYAQKSLALKQILKDNRGICNSMVSVGEAYKGMGNLKEALANFETALTIAKEEKIPLEEANCYFNMAKIFAAQNKDSIAIAYLKKTKLLATQIDNKIVAANADVELTALYKNADRLKQTEKVLVTSLATFKQTGSLDKEADNYKRLSEFYAADKQYDKALENINKYHSVKDSMTGLNVQVQIKTLEEQYNSVKKEKQISLLKIDSELQQQKLQKQRLMMIGTYVLALLAIGGIWLLMNRNKLKQRMKELELRNQIAADLHDEVGSSLSSIHLLSQMAAQTGNEATHKDILSRMSTNAKETMDKMGDIVWMIKPGETEAGSLKQRMERFAYEICSSKNISLSMELDDVEGAKLSMEQRKNIYLIFKEVLNNAVKYSDTESITVSTSIQNKELLLIIKDEGNGFDSNMVKKGNGLDNIIHRATEMAGTLNIDSLAGRGTAVTLTMPVQG
ncbi:MAG: tetratricopeptide repeat protein [Ferruginibacter sp.]